MRSLVAPGSLVRCNYHDYGTDRCLEGSFITGFPFVPGAQGWCRHHRLIWQPV
ncbi:MAG: hypothetical protein MUF37_02870 [Methanoregulaceae archaeon]|nr:hypothetical protein [Methanoregulaceae archaeon]